MAQSDDARDNAASGASPKRGQTGSGGRSGDKSGSRRTGGGSAKARRKAARLAAVQALYQVDLSGTNTETVVGEFIQHRLGHEVDGDTYVAHGRTRYLTDDRSDIDREFANVFVCRFDDDGRCREFTEWFMRRRPEVLPD